MNAEDTTSTPHRGALVSGSSEIAALRAAMSRIEAGESTGSGSMPDPAAPDRAAGVRATLRERKGAHERATSSGSTARDRGEDPDEDRDADPYAAARAIVLRQLAMAPRSRHQLREKLRQRDCPDDVAEAVLDRMTEVGLVDDEKFAEALVRSKQVTRSLSARALAHELRTKGVDKETADAVLAEISPTEEEDRARDLVTARLPRLRGLDRDTVMRRLAGMLARKGYPSGLSFQVIREAIDADPAFTRD